MNREHMKTISLWQKFVLGVAGLGSVEFLALPTAAQVSGLGPQIELSFPNPLAGCNDGFTSPALTNWTIQDAAETCVAVNPANPRNIAAAWIALFQNIITAESFDGGATWQLNPLPLTVCAGGPYLGATDPWISLAPNGDLYASALPGNSPSALVLAVCKSSDGGLHWSAPALLSQNQPDHPSITADPMDARFAYIVWNENAGGNRGLAIFSRTTDGGVTWEPARTLIQPPAQNAIQFRHILVLPDGTLVTLYEQYFSTLTKKLITQTSLQMIRSSDHGQTWSAPLLGVVMTPVYIDDPSSAANGFTMVVDPETGRLVEDPTNPSFAVDRANGNLYAVWEDGRFSNFQYNDIAFSMSADGGFTWSTPIRVNQTPLSIPPLNRQAFLPNVAVAGNGTIGVSYYDFRFNTPDPGLPTDRWLVQCQPSTTTPATGAASWGSEVRLTDNSFNMEACFTGPVYFFVGDYEGLAGTSKGFIATFGAVDQSNITSVFARRVGP